MSCSKDNNVNIASQSYSQAREETACSLLADLLLLMQWIPNSPLSKDESQKEESPKTH